MCSVRTERPSHGAVERVPESEIRIETGRVERRVVLGKGEGVFPVVKVAKLNALCARIARGIQQHHVLDLRPPETLDADRLAAAGNEVLRDGSNQRGAFESVDDGSDRHV